MNRSHTISHHWTPVEDVPEAHIHLAKPELHTLMNIWVEQKEALEARDAVRDFNEGLLRRWAIETGLIERLYTLDRGVTEVLVRRGLEADLIPHGTTNGDPQHVISIIRDQHAAVEGLFDFVASRRDLSTSYIKELHAALTASQENTEAIDSLGRRMKIPLEKGAYKRLPNNPRKADGSLHEYCPPEHVASEMDRLVEMHLCHDDRGVAPEVQSAWLHHRFTQIHPFQDGNGRVARALATLILLRAKWLPLVVTDDRRSQYLDALEAADQSSLGPLVEFFAKIEKKAFLSALSAADEAIQRHQRVDHVIAAMRDDFAKRRETRRQDWEAAKVTARRLQIETVRHLDQLRDKLISQLRPMALPGEEFRFFVDESKPESVHWFRYQLIETAKELGYYANFSSHHTWVRLVVDTLSRSEILVSFHGVGHEYRGVLVGSACFYEKESAGDYVVPASNVIPLAEEVFQFNYREPESEVVGRFSGWFGPVLVKGLGLVRASQ